MIKRTNTLQPWRVLPLLLLSIACEVGAGDARNSRAASDSELDTMPVGVKVEKPSMLKVKPQRGGVTLSWPAIPNAEHYAIYWQSENIQQQGKAAKGLAEPLSTKADPKGVGFGTIRIETEDNATSYFHRGNATGRIHYYRVAAIYANGEEGNLSEPMAVLSARTKQSQPSDGAP